MTTIDWATFQGAKTGDDGATISLDFGIDYHLTIATDKRILPFQ